MSKGFRRRAFNKTLKILLSSLLCAILLASLGLPITFLCVFTDSKNIEPPHYEGMSYSRIIGDGWNIGYGESNIPLSQLVKANFTKNTSLPISPKVSAVAIDDTSPRVDMGGVILVSIDVSFVSYNFTKAVRSALVETMSVNDYSAINIIPSEINTSYLTDNLEENNPFWLVLLETTVTAVKNSISSRQDGDLSYSRINAYDNNFEILKFVNVDDISTLISFSPKLKSQGLADTSIGYLGNLKVLLDVNQFINFQTCDALQQLTETDQSIANEIFSKIATSTFSNLPSKINYCARTLFLPITNYRYLDTKYTLARKNFLPYLASEISFFEFGSYDNHLKLIFNPAIVDPSLEYGDAQIGYHSNLDTIIQRGRFVTINKANDYIGYIISENSFATALLPYVYPLDENHTLELLSPSSLSAKYLLAAWDEMYNWYFYA